MGVSAINSERWAAAGASVRSVLPDWGHDARLFPTREDRKQTRDELKRRALELWWSRGRTTQGKIATRLDVSQSHVSNLLREAGVCVGSGRNTARRRARPKGAAYALSRARVDAAMAVLLARPRVNYGDIKAVALECGVPESSLAWRWARVAERRAVG